MKRARASSTETSSARAWASITASIRGPRTAPGEIRFTRIPCSPASQASVRTRPTSASLDAVYGVRPCSGRFPVIEPITITDPLPRSIIPGSAARQHR